MSLIDQLRLDFAKKARDAYTAAFALKELAERQGRTSEVPLLALALTDAIMLADSAAKAVNAGIAQDKQAGKAS